MSILDLLLPFLRKIITITKIMVRIAKTIMTQRAPITPPITTPDPALSTAADI